MLIFFLILQWLLILIFFIVLILLLIWAWTIITNRVPFISVPNSILGDIHKALDIKNDSVVYDLGCGDGRVLFYLAKNSPKSKYIGLENSAFPIILSRVYRWLNRNDKNLDVKIIKEDFFKHDLSDATHVFTYLYPNVMDDLLSKFDRELKPGTKLVSISFNFTSKKPIAEIDLNRASYKLARKIYIYQF